MVKQKKSSNTIPLSVYLLGLVSFFNDTASEMLYPIMPIFITQILKAPVFVVGLIDGVAEGTSAFFKGYFGVLSDKLKKRKVFVVGGYGTSAVSKIIIAVSKTWPMVFLGRFIDRLGKGIRTGARDALLLESTNDKNRGLIFGIHRTMDSAGAVVGPLIALLLLKIFSGNIRTILYVATIPSLLGLLFFLFIKDSKNQRINEKKNQLKFSLKDLSPKLKIFLIVLGLFSLGNSSDSFLILQSKQLGLSLAMVIFVYVVYNVFYTLLSTPAGLLADKLGAKKVFPIGLIMYAAVYLGFAFNTNPNFIWGLFMVYGGYIAFTDGVSKALIGDMIHKKDAGTAYGVSQTIISIATLSASLIGGLIWSVFGAKYTFIFGAACSILSFIIYLLKF